MCVNTNLRRTLEARTLGAAFVKTHVVQHMIQCNKFPCPARALPRMGSQSVHPSENMGIEIQVRAHGVENLCALLDEARQDLIDVGDREGVVRPVALNRALGSGARTVPCLPSRIALPDEQQILGLRPSRHQDGDRLGFRKSGEIVEMTVLPIGVLDVAVAMAHRSRGQNRDRVPADHAHELPSPAAREISVKSLTISPTSPLSPSRSEIWPVPRPYKNPVHHSASAFARPLSGCSSSGSRGSNSIPCSPNDDAVAVNTRSIIAADSSDRDAPSGSISLTQSCIL